MTAGAITASSGADATYAIEGGARPGINENVHMHKAVEGLHRALYIRVVDRLAKGPPMPAATCLKVIVAAVICW